MKVAAFVDPQFVDAAGVGGLNAAFGQASGSVASLGSTIWATPGLLFPENMNLAFTNLVGSVGLPSPWGLVNASGVVVHAHGLQTGQDTTSYSVDFSGIIPSTGSVTAYLAATVTQIQQNPFPLTGPPQGHPSFNPNFVPTTAYATNVYTISLAAVTGGIDNSSTFELARTTLVPGQTSISSFNTQGWRRAATLTPVPATTIASGGVLTLAQASALIMPTASSLTSTLPLAVSGGGLSYRLVNPSATAPWTLAAAAGNAFGGAVSAVTSSLTVPPFGALTLWGNAASGHWEVIATNPVMMASLANVYTAPQTIIDSSTGALTLIGSGSNGINIKLTGNGSTTPNKYIRVQNGIFQVVNSTYAANILNLDDLGNLTVPGSMSGASLGITNGATIGNGISIASGGIYSSGLDAGGMQIRMSLGSGAAAGFRNDGNSFYLLMSNTGVPLGGFNGLRPLTVSLSTGALIIDGNGAGVTFGGGVVVPNINAGVGTVGAVVFPGGGVISTPGAISSASQIAGATLAAAGNITSNNGRLRAALGAYLSGDPNAAVLLGDFNHQTGGSVNTLYYYIRFPDGTIIQAYSGASVTGGDFVTFPNAFPGTCYEVLAGEGNPVGWISGSNPTIFGTQQLSATNFALYVAKWNGSSWGLQGGIQYRYIAIGN